MLDFLKEIVQAVPDPSAGGTIDIEGEKEEKKKKRAAKKAAAGEPGARRRRKKGDVDDEEGGAPPATAQTDQDMEDNAQETGSEGGKQSQIGCPECVLMYYPLRAT